MELDVPEEYLDIFEVLDDDAIELEFIFFGIPKQIYQRSDFFSSLDDIAFKRRFRLSKESVLFVLTYIETDLEYSNDLNQSVSPINQLLTFLRFCATAKHYMSVGDFMGCHLSTICRIIHRVARAISLKCKKFISMPKNDTELKEAANDFFKIAKFPRIIGTIDCTHIRIQSLGGDDAEIYRNRKGYFSINVQAICRANLKVSNIVARWPGSTHDSTIFNNSRVHSEFESGVFKNYLILGDSGYPVLKYLMTPLLNPNSQSEQLYNESHIRTRNTVERCFGVIKRRFPILAYGIRMKKIDTIMAIITSTFILHNIAIQFNVEIPDIDGNDPLSLLINNGDLNINAINNQQQQDDVGGINQRANIINHYFSRL
ncbi:unnamed protein product [Macrosiphum euphorbiae]|uniref:DDE Tnp4 domain-containing protein n=1 Tax=Macrosiphum euphorbiae TaxID=13131 RepID=A0AAV0VU79_9HEMI|nr:unnamed protein product [Macrosiphum euphorbiae]